MVRICVVVVVDRRVDAQVEVQIVQVAQVAAGVVFAYSGHVVMGAKGIISGSS